MAKQQRTIGVFVLQLALAVYLIITSLCIFGVGQSISSEEIKALAFGIPAIKYILGCLLMVCGICFLIKLFGFDLGKFDDVVKYITLILWIVVTIITLYKNIGDFSKGAQIMHWLLILAKNSLIIGGILAIKNGK
ncbi:MAG TPA: hypothetical protein DEO40_05655 [Treponema sp.]|jgi:hypothetical protein|nr:hypothetical protein [Treponema sp.]HAK69219.1 hypothetical protein [Treponema sp.]HCA20144.1 hypothetical protein [Treponema sp.]